LPKTVTHHKAVDAVRRTERHTSRAAGDEALTFTPGPDDVEQAGWQGIRRAHVIAAIQGLSAVQQQTITLAYLGGYTQSEIALLTGTALGTVKTRSLKALHQLRKNLDLMSVAGAEGWLSESP
jgi:RNA polymerase sigma factor (sigma-70 family)